MESILDHFVKKYSADRKVAVDETIHTDDEMYSFLAAAMGAPHARMIYYKLGSELTRTIMQIASCASPAGPTRSS